MNRQTVKAHEFQWLGHGLYLLHSDGVWRHTRCYVKGSYSASRYASDRPHARPGLTVVDVEQHILQTCAALDLPVARSYSDLTRAQADALAKLCLRWQLAYACSQTEQKRFLRPPVISYIFSCALTEDYIYHGVC